MAKMNIDFPNYFDVLNDAYTLIVTSNSKEKDAVNRIIQLRNNLEIHMSTKGCSIGMLQGEFVVHLTGTSGSVDELSVSRLIVEFLSRTNLPKPVIVFMVGFCWGNPKRTSIDDVVLCSHIISLNSRRFDGNHVTYKEIDYKSKISTDFLSDDLSQLLQSIVIGKLASLETFYSSTKERDALISQYPSLIGGEMEGFGFIPSVKDIPWLIIKSVADFGSDKVDRKKQVKAAQSAASVLPVITSLLLDRELIFFNNTSPSKLFLMDLLIGNTIKISRDSFNSDSLNDYLNDYIGPIIDYKLEFYLACDEYDKNFLRSFCDLILEVSQNSFKHGGATTVSITFDLKKIIIRDNGDDYDLNNLEGDRGGSEAWRRVKLDFISKEFVIYSFKKRSHYFNLIKANEMVRKVIKDCTASIVKNTVGSGFKPISILSYNENCDAIYFDDRNNRMRSRRNTLINEVEDLLIKGKIVYISVNDEYDSELYRSKLANHSERLKILVDK